MRARSISIYAETAEDYNAQFDETRGGEKQYIEEDEYDITSEEDDFSTLADQSSHSNLSTMLYGTNNNSFSNDLEDKQDNDEDLNENTELAKAMTREEEMALLCEYLNKILRDSSKEFSKLQLKKRTNLPSVLSHNAIYSIDTNHIISSLLSACDLPSSNNNDLLCKEEERIILMVISNVSTEKNKMLQTFLNSDNTTKIETRPFDIHNMHISLLNRNVMLEIFNTEDKFHIEFEKMAAVYYTLSHCFTFIIDSSIENSSKFIEERYANIMSYATNKTLVLFDINASKEMKCERNRHLVKSLSEQFGMIYMSMNVTECSLENDNIVNLLTLIFIKKINHLTIMNCNENDTLYTTPKKCNDDCRNMKQETSSEIMRQSTLNSNLTDESDGAGLGLFEKKIGHSSLGYSKEYRLNHFNAFDFEERELGTPKKKANEI